MTLHPFGHSTVHHPITGPVSLGWHILTSVDEQSIVLITAPPGSADHAALRQLDPWAVEQSLRPRHPQAVSGRRFEARVSLKWAHDFRKAP
ncbi:hypothetical protein ABT362_38945 [Nonomuraea rubra]|uniref:hypothetical protein n=1 Tax=Nonomuraea rubra TaxID=46180 RepID=UPI00332FD58E